MKSVYWFTWIFVCKAMASVPVGFYEQDSKNVAKNKFLVLNFAGNKISK